MPSQTRLLNKNTNKPRKTVFRRLENGGKAFLKKTSKFFSRSKTRKNTPYPSKEPIKYRKIFLFSLPVTLSNEELQDSKRNINFDKREYVEKAACKKLITLLYPKNQILAKQLEDSCNLVIKNYYDDLPKPDIDRLYTANPLIPYSGEWK
jgi:hypothetical protein